MNGFEGSRGWMDGARDGTRWDGGVCPPDRARVRVRVRVD